MLSRAGCRGGEPIGPGACVVGISWEGGGGGRGRRALVGGGVGWGGEWLVAFGCGFGVGFLCVGIGDWKWVGMEGCVVLWFCGVACMMV